MYAVIQSGGKQHKVREGSLIDVEKLDLAPGQSLEFSDVLLLVDARGVHAGTPFVAGAVVCATVQEHGRGEKIRVIKFRRRKNYRRQIGHRQSYTRLQITGIRRGQP